MENIYRLIRNAILRFFAQTTLRNDAELDFYGTFIYLYCLAYKGLYTVQLSTSLATIVDIKGTVSQDCRH